MFSHGFKCSIGPLCAFVGGVVAQEIVKAITGKFMPIKQEMYVDITELYEEPSTEDKAKAKEPKSRYSSL